MSVCVLGLFGPDEGEGVVVNKGAPPKRSSIENLMFLCVQTSNGTKGQGPPETPSPR